VGHEGAAVTSTVDRRAFYAVGTGTGGLRDWVTLLHPPYTAWHLSYVAIGAALAPHFVTWKLGGTLLAFLLAVGVGAHAFDELNGRPLRTGISSGALVVAGAVGVGVPVVVGILYGGWRLLPFIVLGAVLVLGYNLELFGGRLHNAVVFALAWGAFPVVVGYYAQDFRLESPAFVAAGAAFCLSLGQRALSAPVRDLRRRAQAVHGQVAFRDGTQLHLDRESLIAPLEAALRACSAGLVLLAIALVATRW
jgi:hypothetical protein